MNKHVLIMFPLLAMLAGCDIMNTTNPPPADPGPTQLAPAPAYGSAGDPSYDLQFLQHAVADSKAVSQFSRVATDKATDARIKSFAARVVDEHRDLNEKMAYLAKSRGVDLPDRLSTADEQRLAKLKKLPAGRDFDQQYLSLVTRGYGVMADSFRDARRRAGDTEIRTFAVRHESVIRDLEQSARQLSGNHR
jgi:putative membrane protein